MTLYQILPATEKHARELAPVLRGMDKTEIWGAGKEPLEGLLRSLKMSRETYVGMADGQVICMFGVQGRTLCSRDGYPWLLGSVDMPKHARAFLKANQLYMASLRERFDTLSGWVYQDNVTARRWLRWLGFHETDLSVQLRGLWFCEFKMEIT